MLFCYVHGKEEQIPAEALEIHHAWPRAYGGLDTPDNRVAVCATCHGLIHRLAAKILSGALGKAHAALTQYFPDTPKRRQRLWKLCETVVQARQQAQRSSDEPEEGVDAPDRPTVLVTLKIPDWLHYRLKSTAPKGKLYNYILEVLANHVNVANQRSVSPRSRLFGTACSSAAAPFELLTPPTLDE